VPEGIQKVTLYFMNPNGHNSAEQNRDYIVEIKDYTDDLAKANFAPALARTRVHDFWGGVYKSFLVSGADRYLIKIDRNYCFNTLVQAVMIDQVQGPEENVAGRVAWVGRYNPPQWSVSPADTEKVKAASSLWDALDNSYNKKNNYLLQKQFRILAYRTVLSPKTSEDLIANWRWQLCYWNEQDRDELADVLGKAWQKVVMDTYQLTGRKL